MINSAHAVSTAGWICTSRHASSATAPRPFRGGTTRSSSEPRPALKLSQLGDPTATRPLSCRSLLTNGH
jgi:hypothetical protein